MTRVSATPADGPLAMGLDEWIAELSDGWRDESTDAGANKNSQAAA